VRGCGSFFARKFDLDQYPDRFDLLDRELLAT